MIIAAIIGKATKSENKKKTSQKNGNNRQTARWGFVISIATFALGASTLVLSLLIYLQSNRIDTKEGTLTTGIVVDEPTAAVETSVYSPVPSESTEKVETPLIYEVIDIL